MLHTS